MKKILFSIAITALLMASCNQTPSNTAAVNSSNNASSQTIAYIDMDTLMNNYDMYADLHAMYELKVKNTETSLNALGGALEKDIADYQEKIQKGLITRATAATLEQELTRRQQEFFAQRDGAMAELSAEESKLITQIQKSVTNFLKEYNKDYRYSMIISNMAGNSVLHAHPSNNITKEVSEGLNKAYKGK